MILADSANYVSSENSIWEESKVHFGLLIFILGIPRPQRDGAGSLLHPAVRHPSNVRRWEALPITDFI